MKRKISFLLFSIILMFAIVSFASISFAGSITGFVTADSDDSPIAEVWVFAETCGDSGGVSTASDGSYTITDLQAGKYTVMVASSDYFQEYYDNTYNEDLATTVTVTSGGTTSGINFSLAEGGKITGVVTADSGGSPIEGAMVSVSGCGCINIAFTASDGSYTISGLPTGDYTVVASSSGDYMGEYYNNADYSSATPVSVTAGSTTPNIDFGLATGGKITGVVTADSGGSPIEGICVYTYGQGFSSANTASDGSYTITGLATGDYMVIASSSGDYIDEYYDDADSFLSATYVSVTAGNTTPNVNFGLALAGEITGIVTADSGGSPLEDICINATNTTTFYGQSADTASDGSYTITGLPAGTYKVEADSSGDYMGEYFDNVNDYFSATDVSVTAGSTTPNINFGLATGGKITGVVTADSDESPIGCVEVIAVNYITSESSGGISDATDGTYTIAGLPTGLYKVNVESSADYIGEYYNNTDDEETATIIYVTAGSMTPNINFGLAAGGKITGVVTADSDGSPIGCIDVDAYDYTTGNWSGGASAFWDGSYIITGLVPGNYRVEVESYGDYLGEYYNNTYNEASATPVTVAGGSTTSGIDFGLTDQSVVDSDNDGLPDNIEQSYGTDPYDADTDDDGIIDGDEDMNHDGSIGAGETEPNNEDTDGDGIQDGTEKGYTLGEISADTDTGVFQPDLDPETTTDPLDADTDDDGITDGDEDADHDGTIDSGETDPNNADTDGDGIQDGTEKGYTSSEIDVDTDTGVFQPDLDPETTTDPLEADTDGDGLTDGQEDTNFNGKVDTGESDPCKGLSKFMPWLPLLLE